MFYRGYKIWVPVRVRMNLITSAQINRHFFTKLSVKVDIW